MRIDLTPRFVVRSGGNRRSVLSIKIDSTDDDSCADDSYFNGIAEALVESGACWRCQKPSLIAPSDDLGLCGRCVEEMRG